MPQLDGKDVRGIKTRYIDATRLTPSQKDYDQEKIDRMAKGYSDGEPIKPIVIGSDYNIIDGHHRWKAAQKAFGEDFHVPVKIKADKAEKVIQKESSMDKAERVFEKIAQERRLTKKEIVDSLERAGIKPDRDYAITGGVGLTSAGVGSYLAAKALAKKMGPYAGSAVGVLAGLPSYFAGAVPTALTLDAIRSKKMKEKGFRRAENGRVNYIPKKYRDNNG